jgi:hypothetical protein
LNRWFVLDEKPVTLHADVRPTSPAKPGREGRRDKEYERRGTAIIFCAVERKAGLHFTFAPLSSSPASPASWRCNTRTRRPYIWSSITSTSTSSKSLNDAFGVQMVCDVWDRFTIHLTPKHGGWLNQAAFSRRCLGRRRIPDLNQLRPETREWNRADEMNRDKVKINWNFDRRTARRRFGYNCNSSSDQ